LLLEKGADVKAHDGLGQTPLYAAAERGKADMVKLLLDKGADPNERLSGSRGDRTPLYAAATRTSDKSLETARLLLEHKADPNIVMKSGTVLDAVEKLSAQRGAAMVKLLKEFGAKHKSELEGAAK
jgi:ankyrin repeat protein